METDSCILDCAFDTCCRLQSLMGTDSCVKKCLLSARVPPYLNQNGIFDSSSGIVARLTKKLLGRLWCKCERNQKRGVCACAQDLHRTLL